MRHVYLAGLAVVLCGIVVWAAGARTAQQLAVQQIMQNIVAPSAEVVYSAVSTTVTAEGVEEKAPRTDEEWQTVGASAGALIEAGNLLIIRGRAWDMAGRPADPADWTRKARALMDAAAVAQRAIDAKDAEALLDSGEAINVACENCHNKY